MVEARTSEVTRSGLCQAAGNPVFGERVQRLGEQGPWTMFIEYLLPASRCGQMIRVQEVQDSYGSCLPGVAAGGV